MRTIQTYILRLLVDMEEPRALRGTIRAVARDEEEAFADGQALLDLLRPVTGGGSRTPGQEDPGSARFEREE
jgi:hypothetical protein